MSQTLYTSYNVELNDKRRFVEVGKKPNGADYRYISYPFVAGIPVKGEKDDYNRVGQLLIDFDSKDSPQKACDEASLVLSFFEKTYDIDPYAWSIFLSGSKGVHLGLPDKYFGLEHGHKLLPKIYKAFMLRLGGNLGLNTVDTSIYSMGMGKPFRLANVKRENGRYKVPIEYDELTLHYDELYDLTSSPRDVDRPVDCDLSSVLIDQMKELTEFVVEAEGSYSRPSLTKEQVAKLKGDCPGCIEMLVTDDSPPDPECRDFNRISLTLIRYAQSAGLSHGETMELCQPFIDRYSGSSSCNTVKRRQENFCNRFWSMNGGTYHFDCGYVRGLRIDGMLDRCAECPVGGGGEAKDVFDVVESDDEGGEREVGDVGEIGVAVEGAKKSIISECLDRFFFVSGSNEVIDITRPPDRAKISMAAFKNLTLNFRKKKKNIPLVANEWFAHSGRVDLLGEYYHPGKDTIHWFTDRDGIRGGWFNPFHTPIRHKSGSSVGDDKILVPLDHIEYLMEDKEGFDYFIGWLAYTICRPEVRVTVTPLSVAVHHGTGRGWLASLMKRMLGAWNCSATTMKELAGEGSSGQYHNYLYQSCFCSIPEVKVGKGRYEVDDAVRDKFENPQMQLNLKYAENAFYKIFTSFFLASNHRDALVFTEEDRRVWVKECMGEPKDRTDSNYYNRLYKWLEDDVALDQFYWYLMGVLENGEHTYNPKGTAPMTREKRGMFSTHITPTEEAFNMVRSDPVSCNDIATYKTIHQSMVRYVGTHGDEMDSVSSDDAFGVDINDSQLKALLRKHCTKACSGTKVKVVGVSSLLWIIRNDTKWVNADAKTCATTATNLF